MSQLALISQEVQALVDEVGSMQEPLQHSRASIERMLAALDHAQRDPKLRHAALVRREHLTRAERAVKDALGACRSCDEIAGRWLAQYAATGSHGGGEAVGARGGGGAAEAAAMGTAGGAAQFIEGLLGTVRGGYASAAQKVGGLDILDGYVFGWTAAVAAGGAAGMVEGQVLGLLTAFGVAGMPAFGSAVAAGILATFVIKHFAAKGAGVEDSGEYGSIAGQIGGWFGIGGARRPADWTRKEWATVTATDATAIALDLAMIVAFPGPLPLELFRSADTELVGWLIKARAHRGAGHVNGMPPR